MQTFESFLNKAINSSEPRFDTELEAVRLEIEANYIQNRKLMEIASQTLEEAIMREARIKASLAVTELVIARSM